MEQENEEMEEKFSKLEIEHKKSLKTIQGLRSYIRFIIYIYYNFSLKCYCTVPCHQLKK